MGLVRSPAIVLVCLLVLMTHETSATTANFIHYTVEVPDDWRRDTSRPNNMWSGDKSMLMVAGGVVKIGPPPEGWGQPDDYGPALDIIEQQKKNQAPFNLEPMSEFSTKKIDGHRLLVSRPYRMNPSTIVVVYYV